MPAAAPRRANSNYFGGSCGNHRSGRASAKVASWLGGATRHTLPRLSPLLGFASPRIFTPPGLAPFRTVCTCPQPEPILPNFGRNDPLINIRASCGRMDTMTNELKFLWQILRRGPSGYRLGEYMHAVAQNQLRLQRKSSSQPRWPAIASAAARCPCPTRMSAPRPTPESPRGILTRMAGH